MSEILSHPIPAVIFLLGILVFVHEFGHYIVGRMCGIAVETFSIGFGPAIVKLVPKGTDFRISWIPLGGYVKFAGSHPTEEVPEHLEGIAFRDAALYKRVLTIAAGPFFNFILAVLVFAVLGSAGIEHPPPSIGGIMENSAAEKAGIQYGDSIVKIGTTDIKYWRDLNALISTSAEKKLSVIVKRDDKEVALELIPQKVEAFDMMGKKVSVGRAGITLGRLPSIVHITKAGSPAALAGIVTGDKIVGIENDQGTTEIKYYPNLKRNILANFRAGVTSVRLQVRTSTPPADEAENQAETRTLNLDLSAIKSDDTAMADLGIDDAQLTIGSTKDELAESLVKGDRLVAWDGIPIKHIFHLRENLEENVNQQVNLKIQRGFEYIAVTAKLKPVDVQKPEGKVTVFMMPATFWGQLVEPDYLIEKYSNPFSALAFGVSETYEKSIGIAGSVFKLFTGDVPLGAIGGPILIAKVSGDSVKAGWQTFLGALALISINLGIINLIPIPVLDGGQLVMLGAEAVRRKPLKESQIENFQKLGFAMILALVVLATYNDLSRFWADMLESIVGVFQ